LTSSGPITNPSGCLGSRRSSLQNGKWTKTIYLTHFAFSGAITLGTIIPASGISIRSATTSGSIFDSIGDNEWLEGGEAIEVILATRPAPLRKMRKRKAAKSVSAVRERKPKRAVKKPRVCVDLDGVLAAYNGWEGPDVIGPPLPGAKEFALSLAEFADIVVFTSRCSLDQGGEAPRQPVSPAKLRLRVIEWLEKFNFPYADVYTGQGKPRAAAFIDDRAVACRPQTDAAAFPEALSRARSLVRRGGKS
jgi:hypothetical protein